MALGHSLRSPVQSDHVTTIVDMEDAEAPARPLSDTALREVEQILAYEFANAALLVEALTHASLTPKRRKRAGRKAPNNERLEFLGDRVLGLTVAHALIEAFPEDAEGRLTDRLVALVRRETLAEIAQEVDLGRWLMLARGEDDSGGRQNPGILADTIEAVLGAVYLDGGIKPARRFILKHWSERVRQMRKPPRDPKMALQEWAHANSAGAPIYEIVSRQGPSHAPIFEVAVSIGDRGRETATGTSKRSAEQAAAGRLLEKLNPGPARP